MKKILEQNFSYLKRLCHVCTFEQIFISCAEDKMAIWTEKGADPWITQIIKR